MSKNIKYEFNLEKFDSHTNENILNYVICSTPRSGSTLLSKALQSTLVVGLPHEYFNIDHKNDYYNRWKFKNIEEYIALLKKNRVTPNGIFGFKLHYNQFELEFENNCLDNYFENLKYIFITRKDKILQGISLEIAYQSNQWSSEFKLEKKPIFNFRNIKKRISEVSNEENKWLTYFIENEITPFVINYEDLENNYETIVIDTVNFLGINLTSKIGGQLINKQRGFRNMWWKKMFQIINLFKK